jgi:antitoxin (DNA-binding transcriptional repressor) of toxin-antitoxin stability system
MKTLTIDDIHADPHRLDALLDSGERIEITRSGQMIAEVIPHAAIQPKPAPRERPDFKARLIATWGVDALRSTVSIDEQFAELRRERRF